MGGCWAVVGGGAGGDMVTWRLVVNKIKEKRKKNKLTNASQIRRAVMVT